MKKNLLEPYNLVRVQEEGYAFVGEVISRPTGDGTIMVRRVPGDPATMEEMSIDKLAAPNGKYKYVSYAVISGKGCVPVDMLRYDVCCPVNFRIEYGSWKDEAILNDGETEFIIAGVSERKKKNWTVARWNSFGWWVKELNTLSIVRVEQQVK